MQNAAYLLHIFLSIQPVFIINNLLWVVFKIKSSQKRCKTNPN